jgi:2-polyprenyl-6-methoxyphenol hydroxylase-like FAD-dependent oxidoreductase
MNDLTQKGRGHAIIIGGSLGGLVTARVLINHFEKVTILEKDTVNRQPESRKGQPQTKHLHGLLPRGLTILNEYFPGLMKDFEKAGATIVDFGSSMHWRAYGGYRKRVHFGMNGITASRPVIEHIVREKVLAIPGVELRDNCSVKQLMSLAGNSRVKGVIAATGNSNENIEADLVIDASGRGSRSFHWLKEMGYATPPTSEVKVNVSYSSRLYRRDPADPRGKNWIFNSPHAPFEYRAGGAFAIEGNRWIVTLCGWHHQQVPESDADFRAFARSLPGPDITDIINSSEPLSEIFHFKYPSSLRRHYEKSERFPAGYLVLGDAACSFNPIYGQGMTVAIMEAKALDELLATESNEETMAKKFFAKTAKIIDIPWSMAVGEDFRYPETSGPRPAGIDFINRYVTRLHKATLKDKVVSEAFLNVMSMLKPPASLFHPRIFWRVMVA